MKKLLMFLVLILSITNVSAQTKSDSVEYRLKVDRFNSIQFNLRNYGVNISARCDSVRNSLLLDYETAMFALTVLQSFQSNFREIDRRIDEKSGLIIKTDLIDYKLKMRMLDKLCSVALWYSNAYKFKISKLDSILLPEPDGSQYYISMSKAKSLMLSYLDVYEFKTGELDSITQTGLLVQLDSTDLIGYELRIYMIDKLEYLTNLDAFYIKVRTANIRQEPNTKSEIVDKITLNTKVYIDSKRLGFYRIGGNQWVHKSLLSTKKTKRIYKSISDFHRMLLPFTLEEMEKVINMDHYYTEYETSNEGYLIVIYKYILLDGRRGMYLFEVFINDKGEHVRLRSDHIYGMNEYFSELL